MRSVVQRVSRAKVTVDGEVVGSIDRGLLAFVGMMDGDQAEDVAWMQHKLRTLRVFEDEAGKMNRAVGDVGGALLIVSQFTLAADIGKGARPSFGRAMAPDAARAALEGFVLGLRADLRVETGRFGADMRVELVNEGPVTLWLDSKSRGKE
jgi:D-tyrosyl-tRNA(Tyr) deacylase